MTDPLHAFHLQPVCIYRLQSLMLLKQEIQLLRLCLRVHLPFRPVEIGSMPSLQWRRAVQEIGLEDFAFLDLRHCAINNLRLTGNDHFTIMAISGHRINSVFRRYNVVTEEELQKVKCKPDENLGVHIGVHHSRKSGEIG